MQVQILHHAYFTYNYKHEQEGGMDELFGGGNCWRVDPDEECVHEAVENLGQQHKPKSHDVFVANMNLGFSELDLLHFGLGSHALGDNKVYLK